MTYFNTAENQDVCDAVNRAIDQNFELDDVPINDIEIMGSLKTLLKSAQSDRELLDKEYGHGFELNEDDLRQIKQGLNNAITVLKGIIDDGDDQPHAEIDDVILLDVGDHNFTQELQTELEARGWRLVKTNGGT